VAIFVGAALFLLPRTPVLGAIIQKTGDEKAAGVGVRGLDQDGPAWFRL